MEDLLRKDCQNLLKEMSVNKLYFQQYCEHNYFFLFDEIAMMLNPETYKKYCDRKEKQSIINQIIKKEIAFYSQLNIPFIGLKGMFLEKRYYDKDIRFYDDIDLLINKRDAWKFYSSLKMNGYRIIDSDLLFYNKEIYFSIFRSQYMQFMHAVDMKKTFTECNLVVNVDIHCNLNQTKPCKLPMKEMFSNSIPFNDNIYVLNLYDEILFLIYNMMRHIQFICFYAYQISISLQQVYDIALIISKNQKKFSQDELLKKALKYDLIPYLIFFEYLYNTIFVNSDFSFDLESHKRLLIDINFPWKSVLNHILTMDVGNVIMGDYSSTLPLLNETFQNSLLAKGQSHKVKVWKGCFKILPK